MSKEYISISEELESSSSKKIGLAKKMLYVNLSIYLIISTSELFIGKYANSTVLVADGKNNFTGIISAILLLVGLSFSKIPKDAVHLEGHWQYENMAIFLAGIIMVLVGINCIWAGIQSTINLFNGKYQAINVIAAYVAAVSGTFMLGDSFLNRFIGTKTRDGALIASAKDSLSDCFTSYGTMFAIFFAYFFKINWIDVLATFLLGGFIIFNGSNIVSNSAEKLSNGFSTKIQKDIINCILPIFNVETVNYVHGRYSGDNIIVECEIEVSGNLKVNESYKVCKKIEAKIQQKFSVLYCCIQVKPISKSKEQ